jgi:hypothetical protein
LKEETFMALVLREMPGSKPERRTFDLAVSDVSRPGGARIADGVRLTVTLPEDDHDVVAVRRRAIALLKEAIATFQNWHG